MALLSAVPAVIALLAWGAGCFQPVKFRRSPMQPFWFAYIHHVGPYDKVGTSFDALVKKARELKLPDEQWDGKASITSPPLAGIYFDNPDKTSPGRCRASIGLRLKSKLSAEQLASAGLQQSEIPAVDAAMVCPWRLAWGPMRLPSIIVGVTRVYGTAKREWSTLVHSKESAMEVRSGVQLDTPLSVQLDTPLSVELYDGHDVKFCFPLVKGGILKWDGPSEDPNADLVFMGPSVDKKHL